MESLYEEVIRAANAGKLQEAEKKLQDMKKEVDKTEQSEWKKRSIGIINYSELAITAFGFLIDAAQTERIEKR